MSEAAGAVNPWLVDGPEVEPWSYTDDKKKPGTVSVEPAASNAYGPEISLQIERGGFVGPFCEGGGCGAPRPSGPVSGSSTSKRPFRHRAAASW
ncbi:Uncharacterised protein [Mycobacteroides abscessus subsp. abscessus]|nr:Uncharacterised protein [Mycobacteroides abscessus subsp. abscessus]SIC80922.1 Uncharacterised protein [Mycobacteroides abscessus subsp. abscessus]SKP25618.1 Uncharacterised protein [Mycobacteroides abscessus subsp. abscessus]